MPAETAREWINLKLITGCDEKKKEEEDAKMAAALQYVGFTSRYECVRKANR